MSKINKDNYLHELFIGEAKPALDRHSGGGVTDIEYTGTVEEWEAVAKVTTTGVCNVHCSDGDIGEDGKPSYHYTVTPEENEAGGETVYIDGTKATLSAEENESGGQTAVIN